LIYIRFNHSGVTTNMAKTLVPILGDQLSHRISSLRGRDQAQTIILMIEVKTEATTVRHHKKKVAMIFSAMRHFAEELRVGGWTVDYVKLDDPNNTQNFIGEISRAMSRHSLKEVCLTEPSEWRVADLLKDYQSLADDRFICTPAAFAQWAEGRKALRMEFFYRDMRRQTGFLMEGDEPVGGQWNFDSENRKPAKKGQKFIGPKRFTPDTVTQDVLSLVEAHFADHFGSLDDFWFATTREEALIALSHFIRDHLAQFGETQDAMLHGEPFLNHAMLSAYINIGLLGPMEVCAAAEQAWRDEKAPIAAVEGFIRQIIGWREYVRGIYWLKMPGYEKSNSLGASRSLPDFYWTGETKMNCISQAVGQTKREAYAHHIQRLMVTGNFALLAGLDPHQVHEWYLAVYADAFEWVEMPNTIGMALHADGGLLGSKPYAASGNYINKMSDYCGKCSYDVKKRTGPDACPFNALYWDFIARHKDRFIKNPRMAQMCRGYEKFEEDEKQRIANSASGFLSTLKSWA
jgi:deoxyribodipyrimidine photolyase-related protein